MKTILFLSCEAAIKVYTGKMGAEFAAEIGTTPEGLELFVKDYQATLNAFEKKDFQVKFVPWQEITKHLNESVAAVIVQSPWDYVENLPQFIQTLNELHAKKIPLFNPANVVKNNLDKLYLQELQNNNIPTIDTIFIPLNQSKEESRQLIEEKNWNNGIVLKHSVSSGGRNVILTKTVNEALTQLEFLQKSAKCHCMVQPMVAEIKKEGEWSFVFLGGKYSHTVLKKPENTDSIKVKHSKENKNHGIPTPDMLQQTQAIYSKLENLWGVLTIARIDVVNIKGKLTVMEIELVDPHIYLNDFTGAADRLADAVKNKIDSLAQEPLNKANFALSYNS